MNMSRNVTSCNI